ncbi:GNAT family N-acetyltransferase [Vibrio sp. SCSIO 43140]|uniref:hypothetical protein n=1 Tax=Vibrio sp. SCSIO 43140 TaxID=2819100 RepID=UPI0020762DA4|nr:hypothetical protein [Vibrio sp. SCSIO 43140]USD59085.1 GNAT family N-acetyltransferase [Vibrio sp. SCSIO 43140]
MVFSTILEKFKPRKVTKDELFQLWLDNPVSCFHGQHGKEMKWHTVYGLAPMEGISDSHGYSMFPDLTVAPQIGDTALILGWVERIAMYKGGTVRIKHFALDPSQSRQGNGKILFNAILELFKAQNAIRVEFHEDHSSKIAHYASFFQKMGVEQVSDRVWRVEFYPDGNIPQDVVDFQNSLVRK